MKKTSYWLPAIALLLGVMGTSAGFTSSPVVTMLNAFGVLGLIYVWVKRRRQR